MTIVLQPYSAMISMTSSITTYQNEHYTTSNKIEHPSLCGEGCSY